MDQRRRQPATRANTPDKGSLLSALIAILPTPTLKRQQSVTRLVPATETFENASLLRLYVRHMPQTGQ